MINLESLPQCKKLFPVLSSCFAAQLIDHHGSVSIKVGEKQRKIFGVDNIDIR